MNARHLLAGAVWLAATWMHGTSLATVLEDDVSIKPWGSGQTLVLSKSFTGQAGEGLFALDIAKVGASTYELDIVGIAELYGFYEVTPGQVFDASFRQATQPLVSNWGTGGQALVSFAPNETKYLAYWDAGFAARPELYGWVALVRGPDGLLAADSVTALGSGIIVGTTTAVPEPANALLFLCGVAAMVAAAGVKGRAKRF